MLAHCNNAYTHPDYTSLVGPLFAFRGKRTGGVSNNPTPSFRRSRREGGRAKQRPGEFKR